VRGPLEYDRRSGTRERRDGDRHKDRGHTIGREQGGVRNVMLASIYECVRFTWTKNRLLGQMTQKTCCGLSTQVRQLNAD
jgi:hypothetical protein